MDRMDTSHTTRTIEVQLSTERRFGNHQCRAWIADYVPQGATTPGLGVIVNDRTREGALRRALSLLVDVIAEDGRGEHVAADSPDCAHLTAEAYLRVVPGKDVL